MPIIEGTVLEELYCTGVPVNGTDEVQTLTIGGTPGGGTFKLRFEGFVTAAITWSATTATLVANIQTALRALASLGATEMTVADSTLSSGIGDVTLTFGGNRGRQAVGLITVETNSLTGSSPTVAIAETTPGVDATARGAPKGQRLFDTTNGVWYQNTGTALAPAWVAFAANGVGGVAAGYKVARGETALDGSNPTPVATGLTTIVAATLSLKGSGAPGVGTSALTYDTSGGTLNIYAWKVTSNANPTLIDSTGTETVGWFAVGT